MDLAKRFNGFSMPSKLYLKGLLGLHIHLAASGDGICLQCMDRNGRAGGTDMGELSMFVLVGECMERLEQREASVWLKPLNQCDLFGSQMLQGTLSAPIRPLWEILFALADRTLSILWLSADVVTRDVKNDVIQRGTSMQSVLANESSRFWNNIVKQVEHNLHSVVARFSDGGLECSLNAPLDMQFKLVELFPCPFYSDLRCD